MLQPFRSSLLRCRSVASVDRDAPEWMLHHSSRKENDHEYSRRACRRAGDDER